MPVIDHNIINSIYELLSFEDHITLRVVNKYFKYLTDNKYRIIGRYLVSGFDVNMLIRHPEILRVYGRLKNIHLLRLDTILKPYLRVIDVTVAWNEVGRRFRESSHESQCRIIPELLGELIDALARILDKEGYMRIAINSPNGSFGYFEYNASRLEIKSNIGLDETIDYEVLNYKTVIFDEYISSDHMGIGGENHYYGIVDLDPSIACEDLSISTSLFDFTDNNTSINEIRVPKGYTLRDVAGSIFNEGTWYINRDGCRIGKVYNEIIENQIPILSKESQSSTRGYWQMLKVVYLT